VFVALWQSPERFDASRSTLSTHLLTQVGLWTASTLPIPMDARRGGLPATEQRRPRSGLSGLHRRITDRAPFGTAANRRADRSDGSA
jgi:hypothetical protein